MRQYLVDESFPLSESFALTFTNHTGHIAIKNQFGQPTTKDVLRHHTLSEQ